MAAEIWPKVCGNIKKPLTLHLIIFLEDLFSGVSRYLSEMTAKI